LRKICASTRIWVRRCRPCARAAWRGALTRRVALTVSGSVRGRGRHCTRSQESTTDDRASRLHAQGAVRARGRAGRRVRDRGAGVRRRASRVRPARSAQWAPAGIGDVPLPRAEDLARRRPVGRVAAGGRRRTATLRSPRSG
jgi:hypothetical protein